MAGLREVYLLPAASGAADGILTALTLTAGRIIEEGKPLTMSLVVRVAIATVVTGVFVMFVASFAQLRQEVAQAERHLNLLARGQLPRTRRLDAGVLRDALKAATVSGICSFLGAGFPLVVGLIFSPANWVGIVTAIVALGLLGVALARAVRGRTLIWAMGLALSGIAFTILGIWLHLV